VSETPIWQDMVQEFGDPLAPTSGEDAPGPEPDTPAGQ